MLSAGKGKFGNYDIDQRNSILKAKEQSCILYSQFPLQTKHVNNKMCGSGSNGNQNLRSDGKRKRIKPISVNN